MKANIKIMHGSIYYEMPLLKTSLFFNYLRNIKKKKTTSNIKMIKIQLFIFSIVNNRK